MSKSEHYIHGEWVKGHGKVFACIDPATSEPTWEGAGGSVEDVDQAVASAKSALGSWSEKSVEERSEFLNIFKLQLEDHKQRLAETISQDTGKPLWESLAEVGVMIAKIGVSIEAYHERRATVALDVNSATATTRYKPHGVCAVLGPFNLPGHLPNGHIIPALLAGNTVVFKPSEQAAAVGQMTMELWDQTGLPPGVINMVQGQAETGAALSRHHGIQGLFFTGSSKTGVRLAEQWASEPWKVLALEMGGNNPLVVWGATDLDAAAYLTIQSAYITAGQRCTCARRLIVSDAEEGDVLIQKLTGCIGGIRVGAWSDQPEPFMGPVISVQAAESVLEAQQRLVDQGAEAICSASRPDPDRAAMLTPGLIDVTCIADRIDQEVFGPLLQVIRVKKFDEAIEEANRD